MADCYLSPFLQVPAVAWEALLVVLVLTSCSAEYVHAHACHKRVWHLSICHDALQVLAVAWEGHLVVQVATSCQPWLVCLSLAWCGCVSWHLRQQASCCRKWCTCWCHW
jgi:hypothetical protein